jgi:hypothetical protein
MPAENVGNYFDRYFKGLAARNPGGWFDWPGIRKTPAGLGWRFAGKEFRDQYARAGA